MTSHALDLLLTASPWQHRSGVTGGPGCDGVVYNEEGGVHPHISSSLIRHEGVGHVNWTVTCNTMADKERAAH